MLLKKNLFNFLPECHRLKSNHCLQKYQLRSNKRSISTFIWVSLQLSEISSHYNGRNNNKKEAKLELWIMWVCQLQMPQFLWALLATARNPPSKHVGGAIELCCWISQISASSGPVGVEVWFLWKLHLTMTDNMITQGVRNFNNWISIKSGCNFTK